MRSCVYVQLKSSGQSLFDEVVRKLKLVESDYFDLEYTDVRGAIVSASRDCLAPDRIRSKLLIHRFSFLSVLYHQVCGRVFILSS